MHLCEPFLSGAPHAYFDAPQGAPVEERCSRALYRVYFHKKPLLCFRMSTKEAVSNLAREGKRTSNTV